jgi:hypothetical protein
MTIWRMRIACWIPSSSPVLKRFSTLSDT